MIGKAKTNHSLDATILYNEKDKSQFIFSNQLIGNDIDMLKGQMKFRQECYQGRGKALTIHAQLSPSQEDGEKFSLTDWKLLGLKYLKK